MENTSSIGRGATSGNNPRALPSEKYVPSVMPTILGTTDMTSTYLIAVFFIVNAATAAQGGPAAFTYLLLGAATFFLPSAIATAQLGAMFPHEGSLYNWTHRALGGYWSFVIGFCAWFPGIFVMISGSVIVVNLIQGLNPGWLVEPWQQGVALACILIVASIMSLQQTRIIHTLVNMVVGLMGLAVLLIGLAGVVWFLTGHHSVTDFTDMRGWSINWQGSKSTNINLFGLITLAYLGTEVPLNMGGEITKLKVVSRHIFWGTLLTMVGYLIATFSLLAIKGSSAGPFDLITIVDMTLGKVAGNITLVCTMAFFVMVPVVYNSTFARLLLVAGIDRRLPRGAARLNKNRIPVNAIIFQSIVALVVTAISFGFPYVVGLANPVDLSLEVYNISQASATLVWAISTAFLFINLGIFYFRDRYNFHRQLVVPMPVMVICLVVGPIACLLAIVDTLFNSWIPQIPNSNWLLIIGGATVACIIIAVVGSMFASSTADWERFGDL